MLKRQLSSSLVLLTILVFLGMGTVIAAPIKLKFAYWAPPRSAPAVQGIIPWAKKIEKLTNGRVVIPTYGGEAMGKAPDHYDLALNGMADIVWIDPNFTPGVFKLSEIFSLPFLFQNSETASAVMWKITEKYLANTDYKRVKVLWAWSVGIIELFSNKPVRTLEDFKGMKLAATSPVQSKIYKALGAKGVYMIEPDIYTALERGMIDGRFHNEEGAWVFKNYEVTQYRTINVKISTMPNIIIMNMNSWNRLPEDIKKIIDAESGIKYSTYMGRVFDKENAHFIKEIEKYDKRRGNPPMIKLNPAEKRRWIAATKPVIDTWIEENRKKTPQVAEMVDEIRQIVAAH